jgi:cell division protein FtsL
MAANTSSQYTSKLTVAWIIIMILFILELFFYTWCRIQCINAGYELAEQKEIYQNQIALRNNLKIELASLQSPDRIAKIAKKQLGLIMPTHKQVIIIP